MQIVINIPDNEYALVKNREDFYVDRDNIVSYVRNGTPLHKGHSWIPVSEKLPEESKRYVVFTKYNDVMTDFYTGERFLQGDDILAWMPLPEPYKEMIE